MFYREGARALFYNPVMRWKAPGGWGWLLGAWSVVLASRLPAAGLDPAPVVTNLFQFQRLVAAEQRATCQVRLQGVVCWAARGGDQMVLQDPSGAALVETDPRGPSVRAGDSVRLEGSCTATGGGEGFAIGKTLVVDNDRNHPWQERAGDIYLPEGKHPLRVAWFVRTGTNGLSVFYQGPGLPRQVVPDSALSQGVRQRDAATVSYLAGVSWRSYEGDWWQVPAFDQLSPCQQGTAANFNLEARRRDELTALCFDGWLQVSRAWKNKGCRGGKLRSWACSPKALPTRKSPCGWASAPKRCGRT